MIFFLTVIILGSVLIYLSIDNISNYQELTEKKISEEEQAIAEQFSSDFQSELEGCPPAEILSFCHNWWNQMVMSFSFDMSGAAIIINSGWSADGFEYFRYWLIGNGREIFKNAIKDPDSLADVAEPDSENEPLADAPILAYEKVTGKGFPDLQRRRYTPIPHEKQWDDDSIRERFPRLSKRFLET